MATLADLLSIATNLECDGKQYPMRPPNQLEQGKFQRWLEQRAYEGIERRTYAEDSAKYAAINALTQDIAAGVYEWGGDVASKAVLSSSGAAKLVELICNVPASEAAKVIDTHIQRVVAIMTAASTDDPKALGEALKLLGLPADFLSPASEIRPSTKRKRKSKR